LGALTLLFFTYVYIIQTNKEAKMNRAVSDEHSEIHIENNEKLSSDSHYAQL